MDKWIIDTDIGDDIDDAFALRYAVAKELNVIAVTTVHRCAYLRAKLCKYFLNENAKDIPVYAGENDGDFSKWENVYSASNYFDTPPKNFSTGEWLSQYTSEANEAIVEEENAVDAIIRLAMTNNQISILALAPLTNIAKAIQKEPKIIKKIKEIIMLGGNIHSGKAEWNIRLDAESANCVLTSSIPIKMFVTDFTWKNCIVEKAVIESQISSKEGYKKSLLKMLIAWGKQPIYRGKSPCLHDVLPVVAVCREGVVEYEKRRVQVLLDGKDRAITKFDGKGKEVCVCCKVDEGKFKEEVISSL